MLVVFRCFLGFKVYMVFSRVVCDFLVGLRVVFLFPPDFFGGASVGFSVNFSGLFLGLGFITVYLPVISSEFVCLLVVFNIFL